MFGYYCVGYNSYNFFKPKSLKDEVIDFILRYNIKHGIASKKIKQIKITDDCYPGESLEHEFNFLHKLEQKIEEKFDDFSCSNFFGKRSMSFCVEVKEDFDQKKTKR